ncbi:MAG: response regulator transcription factor [Agathobacter sp.]|nr:response regulator transcription factor [Agathobacter sp.]
MKIAICDDNIEFLKQIEEIVTHTYKELQVDITLSSFQSGQALLAEMQGKGAEIDMLLLDIDMPEISGLEVAKIVRETNNDSIIMFISSYENYVFDTFEYNPFRFVRKNRMKQELPIALRAAEGSYQKNKKRYVVLRCDEGEVRIEESEIMYFEVVRRQIRICLSDGRVLHTWRTMKELQTELNAERFSKIHSGCVVNLKYVSGYTGNDITLDNGERLTASRGGIKTFKEELSRYWSR